MATYPILLKPSFPYEDHLMINQYVADINKGIKTASSDIVRGQALSALAVSDSIKQNNDLLRRHLDVISQDLELSLDRVSIGIDGLRADFDISMGLVVNQFEMMREEIKNGINHIIDILSNRRKTEAQEHFRDALEFYRDGCLFIEKPKWFEDALRHFLASVEQYERNPIAHLNIGHIYHYHKESQDFTKALSHYRLCYTYGEANKTDNLITAQGYFYAGWLCAVTFDNLSEAIDLTNKALLFDPNLCEAHYHLSKFYALMKNPDASLREAAEAIQKFDSNYWIKIKNDIDFECIIDEISVFLSKLQDEAKSIFTNKLKDIDRDFDPKDHATRKNLITLWDKINQIYEKDNYNEYIQGLQHASNLYHEYLIAHDKKRNIYDRAKNLLFELKKISIEHKEANSESLYAVIKKAETLLGQDDYSVTAQLIIELENEADKAKMLIETHQRMEKEKNDQIEYERKVQLEDYRLRENLCVKCGKPLSKWDRFNNRTHCQEHRSFETHR